MIETQKLIKNYTKICYEGSNGIKLPENYNGLGSRNLIYILFRLKQFYDEFINKKEPSRLNLIFIEEPEAHLHPQMQEVFIKKINRIKDSFEKEYKKKWHVQFIVTTHSSHISNQADFESIRYFSKRPDECIKIKDLKKFKDENSDNANFLHKYLTLTKCDLFFADKVILVEGRSEHILLPRMIKKFDDENKTKLSNQYISIIVVGGAYAHKFYNFLKFIDTYCLIITDIDFVAKDNAGDGKYKSCFYEEDKKLYSSNPAINNWFKDSEESGYIKIDDSLKSGTAKENNKLMITFQLKNDNNIWPRSFEEAFILTNPNLFDLKPPSNKLISDKAKDISNKKTDFAIKYAIGEDPWDTPDYIIKGLKWLSKGED